jgi:hypothetical protein
MEKRLDEEKHTSHLVAMAVTRVSEPIVYSPVA